MVVEGATIITSAAVAVVLCAMVAAVCFVTYVVFLGFIVIRTGGTRGLLDVAVAMKAYRVPLPVRSRKGEDAQT